MKNRSILSNEYPGLLSGVLVLVGIALTNLHSFLLFHSLAEMMGGQLTVESRPGQGSLFWLDLDLPIVERGDIKGIREQIVALEALGEPYQPFMLQLRQLAKRYQIEKIQELVQPYVVAREQ